MIHWICGKVNAGKTTFSYKLKREIKNPSVILDGDSIRYATNNNDYSYEGIKKAHINIIRLVDIFEKQGFDVIVAIVSPYKDIRKQILKDRMHDLYYVHGGKMVHGIPFEEPLDDERPIIVPDWRKIK